MLQTLHSLGGIFLSNIAPILIVMTIGYIFGRIQKLSTVQLGRVAFYVFSPALIFTVMTKSTIEHGVFFSFAAIVLAVFLLQLVIAYGFVRITGTPVDSRPNILLASVSPNMGNYGLPLVELAFGREALTFAALVLVVGTITYNTVGVFVSGDVGDGLFKRLAGVLQVPLFYTGLIGIAFNWYSLTLPPLLEIPVTMLADAAIPAMLVLLGMQLSKITSIINPRLLSGGVLLRLFISAALAYTAATIFNLEDSAKYALILQFSMPVAVMTTIISATYELDTDLAASLVLVTTLISPITLSVLILLLQR